MLREIRGFDPTTHRPNLNSPVGQANDDVDISTAGRATRRECEGLFGFWRATVMGYWGSSHGLSRNVAGYFFTDAASDNGRNRPRHLPLGAVRRDLLALLDRADLTDDERTVIRLYYGLDGLPLPYASKSSPDIAAGRNESSPRGTCRAGIAKVARHVEHRPVAGVLERGAIDPLTESWFQTQVPPVRRRDVVARAWVRAMARCDGPHGPPTMAALEHWYDVCGYVDPDLQSDAASGIEDGNRRRRPNANALNRAAALMEIALYEEIGGLSQSARVQIPLPVPNPGPPDGERLPETVTHPLLAALLTEDLSPDEMVAAAAVLQDLAVNGVDVSGRTTLLLRYLRPHIHHLAGHRLERVAVSLSYVAAMQGNPFLALEWLGVLLSRVGITDRTFTVIVNTIESAAEGGYHDLADRVDRLFGQLTLQWEIPDHQIPFVEHFEAEQQRLAARAYRLERLAQGQIRRGDLGRATESLQRSVATATRSARMAEQVLVDRSTFPSIELDGKAGDHGGDLTWPWALAAAACIGEPLDRLHADLVGPCDDGSYRPLRSALGSDTGHIDLAGPAHLARSILDAYEGPLDCTRYRDWFENVDAVTTRVLQTTA